MFKMKMNWKMMFAKWWPFLFGLNMLCRPSNGFSTHTDENVETNDMNVIIIHKNALPMANIDSIHRNVTSRLCNTNIFLISRVEATPVLKWTYFSGDGFSSACIRANPCFASFVAMSSNTIHVTGSASSFHYRSTPIGRLTSHLQSWKRPGWHWPTPMLTYHQLELVEEFYSNKN